MKKSVFHFIYLTIFKLGTKDRKKCIFHPLVKQ